MATQKRMKLGLNVVFRIWGSWGCIGNEPGRLSHDVPITRSERPLSILRPIGCRYNYHSDRKGVRTNGCRYRKGGSERTHVRWEALCRPNPTRLFRVPITYQLGSFIPILPALPSSGMNKLRAVNNGNISTPTSSRHSVSGARDQRLISSTRIVCANLHWEPIRIHDVETEAASMLVNRSGSPRLEIRNDGVLVEVVDSDCEMVYFAWRLTWPQDQKAFPNASWLFPSGLYTEQPNTRCEKSMDRCRSRTYSETSLILFPWNPAADTVPEPAANTANP
jgi:hypothetical protein